MSGCGRPNCPCCAETQTALRVLADDQLNKGGAALTALVLSYSVEVSDFGAESWKATICGPGSPPSAIAHSLELGRRLLLVSIERPKT